MTLYLTVAWPTTTVVCVSFSHSPAPSFRIAIDPIFLPNHPQRGSQAYHQPLFRTAIGSFSRLPPWSKPACVLPGGKSYSQFSCVLLELSDQRHDPLDFPEHPGAPEFDDDTDYNCHNPYWIHFRLLPEPLLGSNSAMLRFHRLLCTRIIYLNICVCTMLVDINKGV